MIIQWKEKSHFYFTIFLPKIQSITEGILTLRLQKKKYKFCSILARTQLVSRFTTTSGDEAE